MLKPILKFFNPFNIFIILFYTLIVLFIYRGFFYPDFTLLNSNPLFRVVSLIIKIVFPILTISLVWLYYAIYTKKVLFSSAVLLFFSLIIFLLILYPLGEYFFQKRYNVSLNNYHTFLQLKPDLPYDTDTCSYQIFCIGGSTTEFTDEDGRDWPSIVQNILVNKYEFKNVRVYNLGKQWYTTQHSLINYIQNLRKYKPDMVIVMHNINDLLHNADFSKFSNGDFREDYGHFLGPEALMIKYGSLAQFIIEHIKLLWYQKETEIISTENFPGLISFERNLKTMIELARNDQTKLFLMTQPNLYKDTMTNKEIEALYMLNQEAIGNGKKWAYSTALSGIVQYNNKIRQIADEENIYLIDLDKNIPKSLDYFYDDVHYTKRTFDLIGSKVADELKKFLTEE